MPRCRGDPSVRSIDGRPFKVVQVGECELTVSATLVTCLVQEAAAW